ncbi:MAG: M20/M25/M40 family metallo-hydrolase, partial [Verrucomicrobia bacterium]|nr:M20/M25/M40 family metallo-hydrolase [Verrucomicrobiota bacterium]
MNPRAELRGRLIALTRDLMLIPSSARRPHDRERCYAFVRNHVEALDHLDLRCYRQADIPSLLAVPEGVESPEVLLCGHLDVIDHSDPEVYRSHVTESRIVGPGAGDMKGSLAIMLEVFLSIHGRFPHASLGLLITADEETGGESGVRYLFEDIGFRCGTVLLPDGGSLGEIVSEEKGALHLRLACDGHAAH